MLMFKGIKCPSKYVNNNSLYKCINGESCKYLSEL